MFDYIERYVDQEQWRSFAPSVTPEYRKYDPCVYCGNVATTWDHIVPKARGGPKKATHNLTRACESCNREKSSKSILIYFVTRKYPECQVEWDHYNLILSLNKWVSYWKKKC